MKRSRSLPWQNVVPRDKDCMMYASKRMLQDVIHNLTLKLKPWQASRHLCHVYYCFSNASANQKNNYGNKDFSKGFQTLFLKLSSVSASKFLPSETSRMPLPLQALQTRWYIPLSSQQSSNTILRPGCSASRFLAGGFGEGREQGTARSVELQEYFARLSLGANKPRLLC